LSRKFGDFGNLRGPVHQQDREPSSAVRSGPGLMITDGIAEGR
jgi:hypothetical protein